MIVLVTETGNGSVIHWYTNKGDTPLEEIAFASAHTALYLESTPAEIVKDALEANTILKKDPHADVDHYATHVREGAWLYPVTDKDLLYTIESGQHNVGMDSVIKEVKDNG